MTGSPDKSDAANPTFTPRSRRWLLYGLVIATLAVAVFGVPVIPVCRDWGYICEYTGSRKGYRQWWLGIRTGAWYKESALETFMQRNFAGELEHRWTSYAGTGRNIFGQAVLVGHGMPGPIRELPPDILAAYSTNASPSEIKQLYDIMKSGSDADKKAKAQQVWERVLQ